MARKYNLSRFVRTLDKEGYTALFDGLTLRKAYGQAGVVRAALKDIQQPYALGINKTVDSLIEKGFFVELGDDELRFNEIRDNVGKISISNLRLLVSNDCNYACKYCQIEQNIEPEQQQYNMSIEVAQKALELFERNTQPAVKKTITLTGGEPLLNIKTVKYLIASAKTIPNVRMIVFTNGSLITEELADYFASENVLMLVSLDGSEDIHDSVRIRKGGQGTYDVSLRGYELLKRAGCKIGVSAVIGSHNKEKLDQVSDLFLRIGASSIGLNYGHYLLNKPNPLALPMTIFAELITGVYKKMREKNVFVENVSRFVTPFCQEKPRLNECQAQGRGLTVDSRGKIGPCKSLVVSDMMSKGIECISENLSDDSMFQQFAKRSPFSLEECTNCNVIGICGGGCTYDSFAINNGDIKKIDPRLCDYTNTMVDFLMWDLFESIKDKIGNGIYIPSVAEQEEFFLRFYDSSDELQRSVGHEKDR